MKQLMLRYCEDELQFTECSLEGGKLIAYDRLKASTKVNILRHLIDYGNYEQFESLYALIEYIEDSINTILEFYED